MRSARSERSLLGRVTVAATLAAVGGALVAAVSAALVADRAIARAEEQRLYDQGHAILAEIGALSPALAAREVEDEAREVRPAGLRIAVFAGGRFLAGDAALVDNASGCAVVGATRQCTVASGGYRCIVATPTLIGERLETFGVAAALAVATALVIGVALNRGVARWAVAPLARLSRRVAELPDRGEPDLGDDEGVREVDDLRAALVESYTRLGVALSTARRFSADAAHELRTPLTTLSAELELVEERTDDPATREDIQRARRIAVKLGALTERLLVLAQSAERLAGGDAVVLAEVVDQVIEHLDARYRDRVVVDTNPASIVRGDEQLLTAMTENAIHNAITHGGGSVRVSISEHDGLVNLVVEDEGPGIAPAERARVFEPFVRGVHASRTEGHGIGLALIAHVARAHGGTASFGDVSRGAQLRIVLPAWAPRPS